MWFDDSFITEVAERNDIAEVVSEYVKLGKRSGSNLFGLCPFHNEKTPSFSVSPDKQIYHCFGCGKGGGVISFIMEIEGLSYPEAVEFLARRAGLSLPQQDTDDGSRQRSRLYALNRDAARFFYETLKVPGGEKAPSSHEQTLSGEVGSHICDHQVDGGRKNRAVRFGVDAPGGNPETRPANRDHASENKQEESARGTSVG